MSTTEIEHAETEATESAEEETTESAMETQSRSSSSTSVSSAISSSQSASRMATAAVLESLQTGQTKVWIFISWVKACSYSIVAWCDEGNNEKVDGSRTDLGLEAFERLRFSASLTLPVTGKKEGGEKKQSIQNL